MGDFLLLEVEAVMTNLSQQIDEAISKLEYHREQLIYWRQRKQDLEQQLPQPKNILQLVREFLEGIRND